MLQKFFRSVTLLAMCVVAAMGLGLIFIAWKWSVYSALGVSVVIGVMAIFTYLFRNAPFDMSQEGYLSTIRFLTSDEWSQGMVCPICHNKLSWTRGEEVNERKEVGVLICENPYTPHVFLPPEDLGV